MSILSVAAVLGLIMIVYWLCLRRIGCRKLTCSRAFAKAAVFAGETVELTEIVSNDSPFIFPWLRLESRIPAGAQFGRVENLEVSGEMYHRSLFTVMPYQRITRRHRVRMNRRGIYDLGHVTMTVGDVFSQTALAGEYDLHAGIIVYPKLLDDGELP